MAAKNFASENQREFRHAVVTISGRITFKAELLPRRAIRYFLLIQQW